MNQWITPVALSLLGGVLVQIVSLVIQRKKLNVDDNASLRTALMGERTNLVKEIQDLSDRCANLEQELQLARAKILAVELANGELRLTVKDLQVQLDGKTNNPE